MHSNIKNQVHNHSNDLIKPEQIETKNILTDDKRFKDLVIYFTRYGNYKSIKMLSLDFYKLVGKIEEHKEKNIWWLMIIW